MDDLCRKMLSQRVLVITAAIFVAACTPSDMDSSANAASAAQRRDTFRSAWAHQSFLAQSTSGGDGNEQICVTFGPLPGFCTVRRRDDVGVQVTVSAHCDIATSQDADVVVTCSSDQEDNACWDPQGLGDVLTVVPAAAKAQPGQTDMSLGSMRWQLGQGLCD